MILAGEGSYTEEDIKQELERLYAAAGYIDAEEGSLEIAIHLIGAAIVELESLIEQQKQPQIRLVHSRAEKSE